MSNGANEFGVTFPQIRWIERVIRNHDNVIDVKRTKDILFTIERKYGDVIELVCIDEYTCGIIRVYEVLEYFESVNIIYVGGIWNGYTEDAKEYCLSSSVGLFNSGEIDGALFKKKYWDFYKRDDKGNPTYPYKVA